MEHGTLFAQALKSSRTGLSVINVQHKDVVGSYQCWKHRINNIVKHAVSVAIFLSMKTIRAIRSVVNDECAGIIPRRSDLNSHNVLI